MALSPIFAKKQNHTMKKAISVILALIPVFAAFAQTDAIGYNDMIVGEQIKIGTEMNDFVNAESNEAYDLNYKILLQQIDASIDVLQNMGPWQGDATLQTSALNLFKFYKAITLKEYKEFLIILKKRDEEITDADIEYMQALEAGITEKEKAYDDDFSYQQEAFAKRWNFELQGVEEEIAE